MSPSPILFRLRTEHRRLLAATEALETFVAGPPPEKIDILSALRWTFTREMLLHFAHLESMVLHPLAADRRPEVAARAARSSRDLANVYLQFLRHAGRWQGLPEAARWAEYREAIALLMRLIRVRLAAQERDIYALLPIQPGGARIVPACEPVNYSAEAWKIRSMIYADEQRRAASA